MDAAEKAAKFGQTVSEGLNCLGTIMCGPAFHKFRGDVPDLLRRWQSEYAPVFRQVGPPAMRGDATMFRASLSKLDAMIAAGADLDAPNELANLRAAIRDLMVAMRLPIPTLSEADTTICELHGAVCPYAANGAGG